MCCECEDQAASLTCVQCDEHFCKPCWGSQHRRGQRAAHKVMPLMMGRAAQPAEPSAAAAAGGLDDVDDEDDDDVSAGAVAALSLGPVMGGSTGRKLEPHEAARGADGKKKAEAEAVGEEEDGAGDAEGDGAFAHRAVRPPLLPAAAAADAAAGAAGAAAAAAARTVAAAAAARTVAAAPAVAPAVAPVALVAEALKWLAVRSLP